MVDEGARAIEFCRRVWEAYAEIYHLELVPEDDGTPLSPSAVMVLMAVDHLDGAESSVVVRDGSRLTCLGLLADAHHTLVLELD